MPRHRLLPDNTNKSKYLFLHQKKTSRLAICSGFAHCRTFKNAFVHLYLLYFLLSLPWLLLWTATICFVTSHYFLTVQQFIVLLWTVAKLFGYQSYFGLQGPVAKWSFRFYSHMAISNFGFGHCNHKIFGRFHGKFESWSYHDTLFDQHWFRKVTSLLYKVCNTFESFSFQLCCSWSISTDPSGNAMLQHHSTTKQTPKISIRAKLQKIPICSHSLDHFLFCHHCIDWLESFQLFYHYFTFLFICRCNCQTPFCHLLHFQHYKTQRFCWKIPTFSLHEKQNFT